MQPNISISLSLFLSLCILRIAVVAFLSSYRECTCTFTLSETRDRCATLSRISCRKFSQSYIEIKTERESLQFNSAINVYDTNQNMHEMTRNGPFDISIGNMLKLIFRLFSYICNDTFIFDTFNLSLSFNKLAL